MHELTRNCRNCMGQLDRRARRRFRCRRSMESIFPDPFNADTWNLNALSPYHAHGTRIGISDNFRTPFDSPTHGAWVQDDWRIADQLTLNLGLRYDLDLERAGRTTWRFRRSSKPVGPRIPTTSSRASALRTSSNERTVLRGGAGRYYGDVAHQPADVDVRQRVDRHRSRINERRPSGLRDEPVQRADADDEQAFAAFCDVNNGAAGCLPRIAGAGAAARYAQHQNSWQTSLGFQRQLGADDGVRGGLRLQRQPQREDHHGQRQPVLQPGHRRQLSRSPTSAAGRSRTYGADLDDDRTRAGRTTTGCRRR